MSARKKLLDPVAAIVATVAATGSFLLLLPGVAVAVPAALGVGALAYGAKVAVSAITAKDSPRQQAAVGAGADAAAPARIKRGSAVEVWYNRGRKAVDGMRHIVTGSTQPVITGQLENVLIEAGDSLPVLDDLAAQYAVVDHSLQGLSPAALGDQRARLEAALAVPSASEQIAADNRRALDAVAEQEATLARLVQTQAGLAARMESIVLGLERLSSQMSETVASAATTVGVPVAGSEEHLRDLGDQLEGLQAGLAESRRYTAQILGPQADQ